MAQTGVSFRFSAGQVRVGDLKTAKALGLDVALDLKQRTDTIVNDVDLCPLLALS